MHRSFNPWTALAVLPVCAAAPVATPGALAQGATRFEFAIDAQPMAATVQAIARTSGESVLAPADLLRGRAAPALRGKYSVGEALALVLADSGLRARRLPSGFVIEQAASTTGVLGEAGVDAGAEQLLVVGTRIRGAAPTGANVTTVTREAIEKSGYATTQQVLAALPQNFGGGANEGTVGFSVRNNTNANFGFGSSINLRGLGTTSTLTLVDGNRVALGGGSGTFVDLTLVPASFIERIEVLADGASAIYGSDAVAGVVDVRLRRSFRGAESSLRLGDARGFGELQASQLVGFEWSGGALAAAYEFYRRGNVPAAGRPFATEDLRAFGGPDYRRNYANPGTIIAADGSVFAIPTGQDGRDLEPSDLVAGRGNLRDGRLGTDVSPKLSRHGLAISAEQDIGKRFQVRLNGFFADRHSVQRTFPDNYGNVVVPTTNPFYVDPIGTGEPITVNYAFTEDLGPQTLSADVTAWSGIAALEGRFGAWRAALGATYGVQTERQRTTNIPNYFKLAEALADPDPATAYNVFGDGPHTPAATIDAVRGFYEQTGRSRIWTASARADGPLVSLPAGAVRAALGAEFRREHYAYTSQDFEFTPVPVDAGTSGFPLGRSIAAVFGELLVPLAEADLGTRGIGSLTVSLAGRLEHYSDFGATANPKLGTTWTPLPGLTLRGTYGTSFRAPSFIDLRTGRGTSLVIPLPLPDPAAPGGSVFGIALFGGSPGVGPERARSWTFGLDLAPPAVPGFRLAATYFDIAYRDRIAALGADYLTFLADRQRYGAVITDAPSPALVTRLYADENFTNPFGIAADAIAVVVDGRTRNLSRVHQRGLDFDAGYRFELTRGSAEIGVAGAYLFAIDQRVTASAPAVDVVSTIGNPPALRLRARAAATIGASSLAAFLNHSGGYRNDAVTPVEQVKAFTTLDAQFGWSFDERKVGPLRGLRAALSVINLLDTRPPYVNNRTVFSAAGFDPEQASAFGRIVALQVTKTW